MVFSFPHREGRRWREKKVHTWIPWNEINIPNYSYILLARTQKIVFFNCEGNYKI
jgi:hypothetical protein